MPEKTGTKFWEMKAEAGSAPGKMRVTLLLYGLITMFADSWQDDRSAYEIAEELKALAADGEIESITARINSPGGSAFGGLAISNILRNWPAPVTTHVDGLAGSAASIIFAAGDERIMPSNTLLFVHRASGMAWGNAGEMEKMADDLKQIDKAILATYQEITGLPEDRLRQLMDDESFISAQQAKELGFATSIDRVPIAATLRGKMLLVNGLEIDAEAARLPLTEAARAALLTEEAVAAAEETTETGENAANDEQDDDAGAEEETANSEEPDNSSPVPLADSEVRAPSAGTLADSEVRAPSEEVCAASAEGERERIRGIRALAGRVRGAEALCERACFEDPVTPEAFAVQLVEGGFVARAAGLDALRRDAMPVNGVKPSNGAVTSEEQQQIKNRANKVREYLRR